MTENERDSEKRVAAAEVIAPAEPAKASPRTLPKPAHLVAYAAAAAAAVGVASYLATRSPDEPPEQRLPEPAPSPAPSPEAPVIPPPPVAAELRAVAYAACARKEWDVCLAGLDEAKKIDPAGDRTAKVIETRRAAAAALHEK